MVKQTRIIFELGDILSIRLRCIEDDCGGAAVLPFSGTDTCLKTPDGCPRCGAKWQISTRAGGVDKLLHAMQQVQKWASPSVNIQFEMAESNDSE